MLRFLKENALRKGAEEFHLIFKSKNPSPPANTRAIWILSSRHGIEQQHINCAVKSVNYKPQANASEDAVQCDVKDDYLRIKAAFEVGLKLLNKDPENVPMIIYNGLPEQNESFRKVLKEGLSSVGLPSYPLEKIILLDLLEDEYHTPGQFKSMVRECASNPLLSVLNEPGVNVTIVTSAYHGPRTRRLFNSQKVPTPLPYANISFHLIDRAFGRDCIRRDLEGELNRIEGYLALGDIGEPRSLEWFASPAAWTPLREYSACTQNIIKKYDLIVGKKTNRSALTLKPAN